MRIRRKLEDVLNISEVRNEKCSVVWSGNHHGFLRSHGSCSSRGIKNQSNFVLLSLNLSVEIKFNRFIDQNVQSTRVSKPPRWQHSCR